jgi:hypothetical protein
MKTGSGRLKETKFVKQYLVQTFEAKFDEDSLRNFGDDTLLFVQCVERRQKKQKRNSNIHGQPVM